MHCSMIYNVSGCTTLDLFVKDNSLELIIYIFKNVGLPIYKMIFQNCILPEKFIILNGHKRLSYTP